MGGPSPEFEASMKSGKNVLRALDAEQYDARPLFIDREGKWEIPPEEVRKDADCAFVALHGAYGEDGTVQAILEEHGIPYVGSGITTSALAMNQFLTLQVLADHGVMIPLTLHVSRGEWKAKPDFVAKTARERIGYPAFVKPNQSGSSIGVALVNNREELSEALAHIFSFASEAVIQERIAGREFSCGVLDHGWPESAFPLLPTEIIPHKGRFFDYASKYGPNGALHITPPERLPEARIKKMQEIALHAHRRLHACGFSRTDMMMDARGNFYVLEVNTIPGLTEESLLPHAAEASGLPLSKLLDMLVLAGLRRAEMKGRRNFRLLSA